MSDMMVKDRVVGVDISLDVTILAIVDIRGNIMAKDSFPTEDYPETNDFVSTLSEHILNLVEQNGGYETVRSVGISVSSANFLTGGISKAGKWLLEPAWQSFDIHVFHNIRGKVKLLVSQLDDRECNLLGASVLAWKVKEYSLFK